MLKQLSNKEIDFICSKIKIDSKVQDIIEAVLECANTVSVKKRKDIVLSEAKVINITAEDSSTMKCSNERELLGFAFSYDVNVNTEDGWSCKECFNKSKNNRSLTANLTVKINKIKATTTKKGKNPGQEMCQLSISDNTGAINVVCFPEEYKKNKAQLHEDLYCNLTLKGTGFGWSVESIKIA